MKKRKGYRIAVVDGQGGGVGKYIIEKLRKELGDNIEVRALGTNAAATQNMIKAGASVGATGEAAIVYNMPRVDIIMGVVGIIMKNSMLGEVTASMVNAVGDSDALKVLVPTSRCHIAITGTSKRTLQEHVEEAVEIVKQHIEENSLPIK